MEREKNTRDRWLTVEEEQRLLNCASPWLRELILFAIHSGMRMGEILGLTWGGVDLFRRTVTVFKSKNGERRTIPLNQIALELLKHKYGSRSMDTELVFPSEAQTRLNASNISRSLNLALEKAKITNFHFHDLRHTCATRMVQTGVDLYKVQRLLGHKSPVMTQRYAHHYPESLRDGVETLDVGRTVSTNSYMDPAFDATAGCHAMNYTNAGLRLYIRPLGGLSICPGLDEIRARAPHEHNGLVRADNLSRV